MPQIQYLHGFLGGPYTTVTTVAAVDSKKLECGYAVIYAGFLLGLVLGSEDGHIPFSGVYCSTINIMNTRATL